MSGPAHAAPPASGETPHRRFRRIRALINKIPMPKTRRGYFVGFFLIAGFGAVVTVGAVMAIGFTETATFCGLCHTMAPEQKAYKMSAHSELACAECHVRPGAMGWISAKVAGSKQLFQLITKTYPQPIPAPDHSDLPPVTETCLRCHSLDSITANGGPVRLVLRPTYAQDKVNTRNLVAVVLRPVGLNMPGTGVSGGQGEGPRGVHWHVQQTVTYTSSDERSRTIDSVTVTNKDGSKTTFMAANKIGVSTDVAPDIAKLEASERVRTMDCLDCHNRAGHAAPSISQALDSAMSDGKISPSLPYIKKNATDLLNGSYATIQDANEAIGGLRQTYETEYPAIATKYSAELDSAISEIQVIYGDIATPEMKVEAATYPNNLGHQSSPGCFRCHDGAHFKIVNGKATNETIPSTCSTCHTFPQVGNDITGLLLGSAPTSHDAKLWVFNHKDAAAAVAAERNAQLKKLPAGSVDPQGTECGTCHQRSYCEDCHKTGAIKVTHDEMLFNHAASIRISGGKACAYCHQPVFCARCHADNVLATPAGKQPDSATVVG
jgi:nitrate/TMAO reductase-like tetraheme cytochrome c subunit